MGKINSRNKRFTKIEINLSNLENNIRVLKSHLNQLKTNIMAVVKSNAYGHGMVDVSKHLVECGINILGVALIEDGIRLRKSGLKVPIYILGEQPVETVKDALKYDFILGINSYEKALATSKLCEKFAKKLTVNIKIDTGMNRIGINFRKAVEEIEKIILLPGLKIEGIFTHFSCANDKDEAYTMLQWGRFKEILSQLENKNINFKLKHCANSAAFLRYKDMHLDMVRLGISIYGVSPFMDDSEKWLAPDVVEIIKSLKPVLSLKSKISFVKDVANGECISYGAAFKTARPSVIATVPVGYADGYTRLFSNKANVIIEGEYAPVVGNVTMDQIMVDVTDIADKKTVTQGTEVILIGNCANKKITADYLADLAGTISYEILCMLKDTIPRIYIN
ncbi:MAG: alanine racemase [Actinobacteria bacterium]|nr:alanine racemase [Actinomycetota bacterium]MBM3713957.1 alanine racemase [Actinomycetota bacterium]